MDDGHELLRHLRVAALGDRMMVVAFLAQPAIAAPIIGDDQRARFDGTLDEAPQHSGAAVSGNYQTDTTRIATAPTVVLGSARFAVAHLDSGSHQRLVMDASAFATRPPTNPRFIHLDMLVSMSADAVLTGTHHGGAKLVENAERRLVAGQAKLALKLTADKPVVWLATK
jgi:hypothetical protein